jgi:hypothetical protein
MIVLTETEIQTIITEINESDEVNRRASFLRRQKIYNDGGKEFLIEALKKEFGNESLNEMRLAPLNILKKIVNKRSMLYKTPPKRTVQSGEESDQALIDYYSEELDLNESMDKAHRYFTLHSNTALYCIPVGEKIELRIIPPYLYSVVPNKKDQTIPEVYIFNRFTESGMVAPQDDLYSPVGQASFSMQRGMKEKKSLVDSNEREVDIDRQYIFWSDAQHFTANDKAEFTHNTNPEDQINAIGRLPVVNLAKDRDSKFWATQFEDTVDLSLAIMKAWSDLLTISKHQGFSILTITSQEEPKQLKLGINRAIWLKQMPEGPQPSINYVQASSPLGEYKDLIMDLLGLLLSTADLNPKEVGGVNSARNFSSGFQALIETSDTLEAIKRDQNPLRRAEQELWQIIKAWHNYMFDANMLNEDARSFGKFSEDFSISIQYAEMKPLESIVDRISQAKELAALGLVTREDMIKTIYPDMTSEQILNKIERIKEEVSVNLSLFGERTNESEV